MTETSIAQNATILVAIDIAKARHEVLIAIPDKKRRTLCDQTQYDPGEHIHVAPWLPKIIPVLVWSVFLGRTTPSQPITIDEDYTTWDSLIIDERLATPHGKKRFQTLHLGVGQSEKIAH